MAGAADVDPAPRRIDELRWRGLHLAREQGAGAKPVECDERPVGGGKFRGVAAHGGGEIP